MGVIGPQPKNIRYPVIGDTEDHPWDKFERTCSINIATMCLQVTKTSENDAVGATDLLAAKFYFSPFLYGILTYPKRFQS